MSKNHSRKMLWIASNDIYNFTIIALNSEDCRELIEEIMEKPLNEPMEYKKIGVVATKEPYFSDWKGESKIVSTNFYDI